VKHCDEYIEDQGAPAPLRAFLARARSPAHGALSPDPYPRLFADHAGRRVRVTVASRLGHVGITTRLDRTYGYEQCVYVEELSNFGTTP